MLTVVSPNCSGVFSLEHINSIFIPAVLLIAGTSIVKQEWVPYAVAVAAVLSAWKIFSNRA
jgi:cytochrome-b5 reductase